SPPPARSSSASRHQSAHAGPARRARAASRPINGSASNAAAAAPSSTPGPPADPARYANPVTGNQSYGGSRGVRDHLAMLRKAGAAAREMLMQAAAQEWGVPVGEVTTEPGVVLHKGSGRRLTYGQLVDKAAQLPVPQNPTLKAPAEVRHLGKELSRRDTPMKVNGSGIYGMDVRVPGMLVA